MKSVIHFLGDHCTSCIKCVKSCPTEAISIINGKVVIDDEIKEAIDKYYAQYGAK